MPRHMIVSCGTSQIAEEKLDRLKLDRAYQNYCVDLLDNSDPIHDGTPSSLVRDAEKLILKLVAKKNWDALMGRNGAKLIGSRHNPFGAEISTLAKMQQEGDFDTSNDEVTLLYSDTMSGAFCATVLHGLLTHNDTWGMAKRVELSRVPLLREKLSEAQAEEAEKNLCDCIVRARKDGENCLVVTGGFKSAIPFFTTVALVFGDKMYSLFERSEALRRLTLPREVREELDKVEPGNRLTKVREIFSTQRTSVSAGLQKILEERAKRDDMSFGSQ